MLYTADLDSTPFRPSRNTTQLRLGASDSQDLCLSELEGADRVNSPIALTLQTEELRPGKKMDFSGVT